MDRDRTVGGIVGLCIGDALGLPVHFRSRSYLRDEPVDGMIGFGTHNQPPGTWSSNSSLALCTVESLASGFSLADIAARYVLFAQEGRWTPAGEPVDLAPPVLERIHRLARQGSKHPVEIDGDGQAFSVLSRTLPLAGSLSNLPHEERFKRVAQVTSLTNGSMRTVLGSFILVELALELAGGQSPSAAYRQVQKRIASQLAAQPGLSAYARLLEGDLSALREEEIYTEGEVVHTVEAAVWCVLRGADFRSVVLTAVNLGGTSHTTASLAGALCGYATGLQAIPKEWRNALVRGEEIIGVGERLFNQSVTSR